MILSLIVPAYNVAKYLERCINSCSNQCMDKFNYEIIIVNDGSTDNTLGIAQTMADRYSNVRIISQENKGLSSARNIGLEQAVGDYVWFIDSDDWIKENCLSELVKILVDRNLDALYLCAADVMVDGTIDLRQNLSNYENFIYSGVEFSLLNNVWCCAPFTIYRRQFLKENHLEFMVGVFHEDNEFTPRAYYKIEKVSVYAEPVYFIFHNPNSITRSPNYKKAFDCLKVAKSLYRFNEGVVGDYRHIVERNIVTCVNNALCGINNFNKEIIFDFKQELKKNKILFLCFFKMKELRFKIEGIFFYLFPTFAPNIYKLFNILFFHRKVA